MIEASKAKQRKDSRVVEFPRAEPSGKDGRTAAGFRRHLLLILGSFAAAALAYFGYSLWREFGSGFPQIEVGSYLGTIEGGIPGEDRTGIYLERSSDEARFFVAVLSDRFEPHEVWGVAESPSSSLSALLINGADSKLKLVGSMDSEASYSGVVKELKGGTSGVWRLEKLESVNHASSPEGVSETRHWMMLRAELEDVEARIYEASITAPSQRSEIEKLTRLITEGDKLKEKAREKFNEVKNELEKVNIEIKSKSERLQALDRSLDISQRVTGMGKLVSLARESMEREWRYVDSMLRSSADEGSRDFEEAYTRAQQILDLKREIEFEQQRINDLILQQPADPRASLNNRSFVSRLYNGPEWNQGR